MEQHIQRSAPYTLEDAVREAREGGDQDYNRGEAMAASSKNRLSHGLCSTSLLVFGETQEEFDALRQQTHQTFAPATPEELFLTDQLTDFDLSDAGLHPVDQATAPQLAKCFFDGGRRKAFSSLQGYIAAAGQSFPYQTGFES